MVKNTLTQLLVTGLSSTGMESLYRVQMHSSHPSKLEVEQARRAWCKKLVCGMPLPEKLSASPPRRGSETWGSRSTSVKMHRSFHSRSDESSSSK